MDHHFNLHSWMICSTWSWRFRPIPWTTNTDNAVAMTASVGPTGLQSNCLQQHLFCTDKTDLWLGLIIKVMRSNTAVVIISTSSKFATGGLRVLLLLLTLVQEIWMGWQDNLPYNSMLAFCNCWAQTNLLGLVLLLPLGLGCSHYQQLLVC